MPLESAHTPPFDAPTPSARPPKRGALPEAQEQIISEFRAYGERHGGPLARFERFEHTTSLQNWSHRQWEIGEWLAGEAGRGVSRWLALDDEELLEGDEALVALRPTFEGHVLACESHVGLTAALAELGVELLKAQSQARRTSGAAAAAEGARPESVR